MSERIGKQLEILICGYEEDGQLFGRAKCQAPDVDGITFVPSGDIGDIIEVAAIDSFLYDLEAEL